LIIKVYKIFSKIEEIFVCLLMFVVSTLIFLQVLNRYVGHFGIVWINDIAIYMYILMMSFNWSYATSQDGHCAVEVFQELLLKDDEVKILRWGIVSKLFSIVATVVFLYLAYPFLKGSIKYTQRASLMPWFHENWLQTAFYIAGIFVIVHLVFGIIFTLEKIRNLKEKRRNNPNLSGSF